MKPHHTARYVGIYRQIRSERTIHRRRIALALGMVLTSTSPADELIARYIRLDSSGKVFTNSSHDTAAACIEDRHTGLIWELKTHDAGLRNARHTYTWNAVPHETTVARCGMAECNVAAYIAAVNSAGLCGASDWRLPAREEQRSIVDYSRAYPGPTINTAVFEQTVANFYWSSNEDASDRRNAWGIGFAYGFDYAYPKENAAHVRLVRAPHAQISPRYEALGNGIVRDLARGVAWQRCSDGQSWNGSTCTGSATRMTYVAARARQLAPWRLPSLTELAGLVDTTYHAPSIANAIFPNTETLSYWSDTPLAGRPSMVWLVNFMYGDNFVDSTDERAVVRWVRDE